MIEIVGFEVRLVAVIVGFIGVLTIAGPDHPLTDNNGDRARRRNPVGTDTAVDTFGPQSRGLRPPKTKESVMSIGKKIAHKAEAAKGAAKKYFGRATGNTRLRTEGRVDQFTGNTKQAGDKVKDAFKH